MSNSATAHAARPDINGSRTMTITPTTDTEAGPSTASPPTSRSETPSSVGVLRLRGAPARRQHVNWASDTVDNEGMGKKKSKICCIYHKPRAYDESSSESDSCDSDDGGDSCRRGGQSLKQRPSHPNGGDVQEQSSESESDGGGGDGRARPARKPRRKPHKHNDSKANKYDVQPKPKN